MEPLVVDTNVVSYVFKKHSLARSYEPLMVRKRLIVSFMTVAELEFWPIQANWGKRQRDLPDAHLESAYEVSYADRRTCRLWAELTGHARQKGLPLAPADAWIAATAVYEGAALLTHDARNFAGVADRVKILSAV